MKKLKESQKDFWIDFIIELGVFLYVLTMFVFVFINTYVTSAMFLLVIVSVLLFILYEYIVWTIELHEASKILLIEDYKEFKHLKAMFENGKYMNIYEMERYLILLKKIHK